MKYCVKKLIIKHTLAPARDELTNSTHFTTENWS